MSTTGKPTIEIVSHCYAEKRPHYADALCYQLSSLVLHPPKRCNVLATVIVLWSDRRALAVTDFFRQKTNMRIIILPNVADIGRRACGRNRVARDAIGDIVWFADGDYCFGDGCLDALADLDWPDGIGMVFPRQVMIHRNHETGGRTTDKLNGRLSIIDIDPGEFTPKKYRQAIGGVQIVSGAVARRLGYLDGTKWVRPRTKGEPFADTKEDVQYRKQINRAGLLVCGVDLPNLYRIRQLESFVK